MVTCYTNMILRDKRGNIDMERSRRLGFEVPFTHIEEHSLGQSGDGQTLVTLLPLSLSLSFSPSMHTFATNSKDMFYVKDTIEDRR